MLRQELVELLVLSLVQVRLVHHDQSVRDVHRLTLEVLAEENLDLLRLVGGLVSLLRVLDGLLPKSDLARAAKDVDTLDLS